jgi:hypothetical protein
MLLHRSWLALGHKPSIGNSGFQKEPSPETACWEHILKYRIFKLFVLQLKSWIGPAWIVIQWFQQSGRYQSEIGLSTVRSSGEGRLNRATDCQFCTGRSRCEPEPRANILRSQFHCSWSLVTWKSSNIKSGQGFSAEKIAIQGRAQLCPDKTDGWEGLRRLRFPPETLGITYPRLQGSQSCWHADVVVCVKNSWIVWILKSRREKKEKAKVYDIKTAILGVAHVTAKQWHDARRCSGESRISVDKSYWNG